MRLGTIRSMANARSKVRKTCLRATPFSDQFWTICMKFGKSATNFDIAAAESCPTGRRNAEPPKLPALFPCLYNYMELPASRYSDQSGQTIIIVAKPFKIRQTGDVSPSLASLARLQHAYMPAGNGKAWGRPRSLRIRLVTGAAISR